MRYNNLIETYYPSLTKSEKKIADYVLAERSNVAYESSQEITNKVNVGEATLNRFCKKIGFSGFQELKLAIAKDDAEFDEADKDLFVEQIEQNYKNTITRTKDVLNMENLNEAIHLINNSNQIIIIGAGASGLAANECETSFLRVGKYTKSLTDPHFQAMHAALLGENDLLIVFSLSGYTSDILETVLLAKENGVKVITATNYLLSPIAMESDCVLLTAKKETLLDGGSLMAKVSQLYIIDLLCTGYSMLNEVDVMLKKEKIARSVINKTMNQ